MIGKMKKRKKEKTIKENKEAKEREDDRENEEERSKEKTFHEFNTIFIENSRGNIEQTRVLRKVTTGGTIIKD